MLRRLTPKQTNSAYFRIKCVQSQKVYAESNIRQKQTMDNIIRFISRGGSKSSIVNFEHPESLINISNSVNSRHIKQKIHKR